MTIERDYYGLIFMCPPKLMLGTQPPGLWNVNLFGNRVIAIVAIKIRLPWNRLQLGL